MLNKKRNLLAGLGSVAVAFALSLGATAFSSPAFAQAFPSRPLTLIVPFPAGGNADVGTRTVMQKAAEILQQSIVVENRSGANGQTGANVVKAAAPDGYTLFLSNIGTHAINQTLFTKLSYDPVKDFSPVTVLFTIPHVLIVNNDTPVNSVKELVNLAKQKPGSVSFASQGIGSGGHLLGELFKKRAGIDIIHVPYRGTAQAIPDLLSGRVQMFFDGIPVPAPLIRDGKVKGLATPSEKRLAMFPNMPTMAESGYPGVELSAWFGISAPANTPKAVINTLNDAIVKALKDSQVSKKLEELGFVIIANTPEEFATMINNEIEKWGAVVKEAGARID